MKLKFRGPNNQKGLASILVVGILMVILSLITITFVKVMNRNLDSSLNSQLAGTAYYAAEAAINDTISYLSTNPTSTIATTGTNDCNALVGPGNPLNSAASIESNNTKYTCILVDPTPPDLFFQNSPAYESRIFKVGFGSQRISSIMFSWQSTNRNNNQFVSSGSSLLDETAWGNSRYAPVLRVGIYPVAQNGDMSNTAAHTRTFFLYPRAGGVNVSSINYGGTTTGEVVTPDCSLTMPKTNSSGFVGTADFDCNAIITGLQSGALAGNGFYLRITPLYGAADVKIKANDTSGNIVNFENIQSIIDATAKSGETVKRLQARVNTTSSNANDLVLSPGDNYAPEQALRSSKAICKRLKTYTDPLLNPSIEPVCNTPITVIPPPAPVITFTASANPVVVGGTTVLNWSTVNATSCTASGAWTSAPNAHPLSGSSTQGPFGSAGSYTYNLSCDGPGGTDNESITITVNPGGGGGLGSCTGTLTTNPANGGTFTAGQQITYTWAGNCSGGNPASYAYYFQSAPNSSTTSSPPTLLGNLFGWGSGPVCGAEAYGTNCWVGAAGSQPAPAGSEAFCVSFTATPGDGGPSGGQQSCLTLAGGGGGSPPNVLFRSSSLTRLNATQVSLSFWVSHAYDGCSYSGAGASGGISWSPAPLPSGDNGAPQGPYTIGVSSSGGTFTLTCYGSRNPPPQSVSWSLADQSGGGGGGGGGGTAPPSIPPAPTPCPPGYIGTWPNCIRVDPGCGFNRHMLPSNKIGFITLPSLPFAILLC